MHFKIIIQKGRPDVADPEYVRQIMPVEYTAVSSDALCIHFETNPFDSDSFENDVWNPLEALIEQTGSFVWTLHIEDGDTGVFYGNIVVEETSISYTKTDDATPEVAKETYTFGSNLKDYIISKSFEMAMRGALKSVTSDDDKAPMAGHIDDVPETDLDKLVEAIKSKTKADIVKPKETLADYVCNPALMEELQEIKDFFENAIVYKDANIKIPKGILFKGAPGTGKTYAARCIAGSVDCYFMTCTASALQGMYIGSGAENIREVFNAAKALQKASKKGVIIFLDELDSFGSRDSHNGSTGGEEDRTLNQLLAEMSGFEDSEMIMIMGATNYPDRIDDALLRSGRFSRQISIDLPDEDERRHLVKYYYDKMTYKRSPLLDYEDITQLTENLTPADIAEICNESGILAIRQKSPELTLDHVNEAINKVITKNIRKPDKDAEFQERVAIHECGHVLAEYVYGNSVPIKVTNYSYGNAGGFTQSSMRMDGIIGAHDYKAKVMELLGGRAAEEALLSNISTGASEDFARAKNMIRAFYETYHFEPYESKDLDQKVLDTMNVWYEEVVDAFRMRLSKLKGLSLALRKERTLYKRDMVALLK